MKHSGTTVETNYYDGLGRRVASTSQGVTTFYAYDPTTGVLLYEGCPSSTTDHVYADGIQVSQIVGGPTGIVYHDHADHLGSVRMVTDTGGSSVFSSNYIPYGLKSGQSGSNTLQYAGVPYDSATGLYYMGSRYYDPSTGRFITEDRAPGRASDPLTLNRYSYAKDNPMSYVDPSGYYCGFWQQLGEITGLTQTELAVAAWGTVAVVGIATVFDAGASAGAEAGIVAAATEVAGTASGSAVIGAMTSSGTTLGLGLVQGNANPESVFESALLGGATAGASEGLSAWMAEGSVLSRYGTQFGLGSAANFAGQEFQSWTQTGHWTSPSILGVLGGGIFAVIGTGTQAYWEGILGKGLRSAAFGSATTGLAEGVAGYFSNEPLLSAGGTETNPWLN